MTNSKHQSIRQRRWGFQNQITLFFVAVLMLPASSALPQQELDLAKMRLINSRIQAPYPIDDELVKAAGIDKYVSKHLILYTDLRDKNRTDDLLKAFDAAVKPWCDYYEVDPKLAVGWKLRAFLIASDSDDSRFRKAKLLPDKLPKFAAGYQNRHNLYLYGQRESYYMRHLLLHEGAHGFALWFCGGYGAPWYSEGMAEQFGVHRWEDGKLTLRHRLRDRLEAAGWGRIKLIRDEVKAGKGMSLEEVLQIPNNAFRDVRFYAWSWAGCEFFSRHPLSAQAFKSLRQTTKLDGRRFNEGFKQQIQSHWKHLSADWNLFIQEMDYGIQVERLAVSPIKEISSVEKTKQLSVDVTRGWQRSFVVKKGQTYSISANGRFKVGQSMGETKRGKQMVTWPCEANGISIQYYRGHRLGKLMAGVIETSAATPQEQVSGLLEPVAVGKNHQFTAKTDGVLCFRINESPAHLEDNSGVLEVRVEQIE